MEWDTEKNLNLLFQEVAIYKNSRNLVMYLSGFGDTCLTNACKIIIIDQLLHACTANYVHAISNN